MTKLDLRKLNLTPHQVLYLLMIQIGRSTDYRGYGLTYNSRYGECDLIGFEGRTWEKIEAMKELIGVISERWQIAKRKDIQEDLKEIVQMRLIG